MNPTTPTTPTTPLTPAIITNSIVLNSHHDEGGEAQSTDQTWLYRSLLLLCKYMEHDLVGYRANLGSIENRNSPRYWLEWMSNDLLPRHVLITSLAADHVAFSDGFITATGGTYHGRPLSGTHLESAILFFTENPSVSETVYKLASNQISLTNESRRSTVDKEGNLAQRLAARNVAQVTNSIPHNYALTA